MLQTILKKTTTKQKKDRTLGQMVKSKLYRQNHTNKHIHTHSRKEKRKKNIYIYKRRKKEESTKSITNLPMIISSKY